MPEHIHIKIEIADLHIHHHGEGSPKLDAILAQLKHLTHKETQMAHSIDEVVAKVQEQTTLAQSVATFIQQLKDQLAAQGVDQAKIDAAFSGVEGNDQVLADAIVANTPAAPTP